MAYGWITQQADRASDAGASAISFGAWSFGHQFPAIGSAGTFTVTEIGVYCDNSGAAGGGTCQMAIYTTGGTLVGSTGTDSEKDPPGSEGWLEWTGLSIEIDGETEYVVVVWPDDTSFDLENACSSGGDGLKRDTSPGTPWTWGDMTWADVAGYEMNIYGVYEAAGGAVAPTATLYGPLMGPMGGPI